MKKWILNVLSFMPVFAFAQAVLPTAWNFSTPGVATPPVGWTYNLGTGSLTYASGVGDAVSLRLDLTGEYLQIQFAEKPGPLSYYIKGTGISPAPAFTGSFSVEESVDGNTWSLVRNFTTMNTNLTRVADNLLASTRYVRFFYTSKQSGSNVQLDSVMISLPPPPTQGIAVKQNNNTMVNGGDLVFGNVASRKFFIQNIGISQDLRVDSIVVRGTHASDFSIGAFDSITPFNNGLDSFNVNFNAGANGSRLASLFIYSTDADKNPFQINMYAIGGTLATEPAQQVAAVNISAVKTFGMNVSFPRAAGAEKYIVLRKTGTTLTERPVDGTTYQRGDYIGGAQVAYIGNDTALIKPNYILANTDYTFVALSYNGPAGYENYNTTNVAVSTVITPGGNPGTYYNTVNPLSFSFVDALNARLKQPHDTVFYSNYAPTLINTYLTRDTSGGKKVVDCVYTGLQYIYDEPFLWWNGTNSGVLTREHTFAQSWMPSNSISTWPEVNNKEVLEYNDLHNLFPAHQANANAKRSNYPFGIVTSATYTSPTGFGKLGTNAGGQTVYEPRDDQKGDLARALFYMLIRYNGDRNYQWRLPAGQDINLLIQWHQQDPPSKLEIARNEFIAATQKNRNPFIDNPTWVNRINFSNLTYIPDPSMEFINLVTPNGGQVFNAGTTQNITWTAQHTDTLIIEYKVSPTSAWVLITDTVPAGRGMFPWLIPNLETTTATIRLTEKGNTANADSSNAYFRINPIRSLVLTAPNGGEILTPGSSGDFITWNSSFVDSVKIELYVKDTLHSVIATASAASGKYNWQIPGALMVDSAKIRISNTAYSLADTSNGYFAIKSTIGFEDLTSPAIQLYPNPTSGVIYVSSPQKVKQISVKDITGKQIAYEWIDQNNRNELYIQGQGVFFITFTTFDDKVVVQKCVKQ